MRKVKAWLNRILPEDRHSRIACIVFEILAIVLIIANIVKRMIWYV